MARPLRIEFEGAVYHVTSRGNARQDIFLDDADRSAFLEVVASAVKRYNWLCHAYCLMSNHYHLVIETPDGNLSEGMRHVNGVYTQRFNRTHRRIGHLFQGRFKAVLVGKDSHLLELCRYVVLNPVRAGLVKAPAHWKWSSYSATAGRVRRPRFLTVAWLLSQFGTSRTTAQEHYKKFVYEGKGKASIWNDLKGQVFLGTEDFVNKFKGLLQGKEGISEIPRPQRYANRPTLKTLLPPEIIDDKRVRDRVAYKAHVSYGYSLKEIADHLGVHYVTVSRAIVKTENEQMS